MRKVVVLVVVFIIIGGMSVNAQVMFKAEYFGKSSYRTIDGDTDEKVGNSKGSAMVYQGGINVPFYMKLNENNRPTMWAVNVGGAYTKLTNENFTEPLVINEIMNLGISLNHIRPLNDTWSMIASIGGGLYMPSTRLSKARFKNVLGSAG